MSFGAARRGAGLRRSIAAAALGAGLLVALAASASAHAGFVASDPSDGEVVPTAPSSITMSFTEPPDPDLSAVTVLDASGADIPVEAVERGAPPRSLEISLPSDLADGVYTVSFIVVSEADGHKTPGVLAFGVGASPGEVVPTAGAGEPETPRPSPLAVVGKVLLYAGLAVAVGLSVTGLAAFGGVVPARRWLLPAAGTAGLVGAVVMTVAEAASVDASLRELLSSATGRSYAWLLATTALTLVASAIASRSAGRAFLAATGVGGAAAMLVRATSGHAAALVPAWPAELAQFVHFVAIGVWIGGLVSLLFLLRERRASGEPGPVADARRFSRLAGWAVLAVVLTGLARTITEAGGVDEVLAMLTRTGYGTALTVKVALAAALIGLGAFNRRRSIPRLSSDGSLLRRVVTIEVAAAIGVFGLTGTMTSLDPDPAREAAPPALSTISASGADFATTTRVTMTATPGTAGPNTFEATVVDFDGGAPVAADEVTARFTAIGRPEIETATLRLEPAGDGATDPSASPGGHDDHQGAHAAWTGTGTQLSLAGAWDVVIQVRSGARTTEVPLVLVTRAPPTTSIVTESSGDLPEIETFTLATGEQLQVYLDPGAAGMNEFHVTAFDAQGDELALSGLLVVAVGPDGTSETLDATRLTPGHFAAPAEVEAGRWRFEVVATTEGGTVLQAVQEQEVGA